MPPGFWVDNELCIVSRGKKANGYPEWMCASQWVSVLEGWLQPLCEENGFRKRELGESAVLFDHHIDVREEKDCSWWMHH